MRNQSVQTKKQFSSEICKKFVQVMPHRIEAVTEKVTPDNNKVIGRTILTVSAIFSLYLSVNKSKICFFLVIQVFLEIRDIFFLILIRRSNLKAKTKFSIIKNH